MSKTQDAQKVQNQGADQNKINGSDQNQAQNCIETISSSQTLSYYEETLQKRAKADLSELSAEQQFKVITNKVSTQHELPVNPTSEILLEQLTWSKENNKPLIVKFGIDPTGSDAHVGHMVSLMMADRLIRMGHHFILIVGDFTAKIGDGSGRSSARTALTDEQIQQNLQTYKEQASKVIDIKKVEYRFNGEWLGKLSSSQIIALCQKISASQMWQREDFQRRLENGSPISMAELMYPIFMAMDSVELEPDIELGGLDQYINLLWCREIMKIHDQKPETFITVDLIPGTDGTVDEEGRIMKMSKSYGNYIAVNSSPEEMFGKTMSIPDSVMWIWLRELTELYEEEISSLKNRTELPSDNADFIHPKELKKTLARLVVGRFNHWDMDLIAKAEKFFEESTGSSSKKGGIPEDADVKELDCMGVFDSSKISMLGKDFGMSGGQIRRLIEQGGVKVLENDEFVSCPNNLNDFVESLNKKLKESDVVYLRLGKRNFLSVK